MVWDIRNHEKPIGNLLKRNGKYKREIVRALAWNPNRNGIIASSGGIGGSEIKIWDTKKISDDTFGDVLLNKFDTKSKVSCR